MDPSEFFLCPKINTHTPVWGQYLAAVMLAKLGSLFSWAEGGEAQRRAAVLSHPFSPGLT